MTAPVLLREWRTVQTSAGEIDVHVTSPADGAPRPTILMLQEIFGVNAAMRAKAERFAEAGYAVAMPDLFWRQARRVELGYGADDRKRGFGLMQGFDVAQGVSDLAEVAKALAGEAGLGRPLSVVGYCLGGKLAVLLGERIKAAAVISFYGVRLTDNLDVIARMEAPLQIHVGDADEHIPQSAVADIQAAVAGQPNVEVFVYPGAGHGFFNAGRQDVYHQSAADLAFQRALAVLPRTER